MSIDSLSDISSDATFTSLRPTIQGTAHVVSSGHHLASQAAYQILEAGGNAVDAGVAAGLALGVLQSEMVNIAGVAPIIFYHAQTQKVLTISGLGWWPRALDPDLFMREHGGEIPEGILRTVVPGAPDAWLRALADYGTMSFGEVARAAISYARDGFVMYPFMAEMLRTFQEGYARWPSNAEVNLPGGRPPDAGELFRQPELARTLQYMADCESAEMRLGRIEGIRAARDAFYCGDIARAIVKYHEENGGLLTMADLAGYSSEVEEAVARRVGDATLYTCGAWCQGPAMTQILQILDGYDLASMTHNGTEYSHLLTEAVKLAFADRHAYYGDPRFVPDRLNELLAPGYAARQQARIDPRCAAPEMPRPGLEAIGIPEELSVDGPGSLDTSYVAVIDKWGNIFSATPSDVSHDAPIIPGWGICPSSRGSQSWADPSLPAGVYPGKRPRLTPNPAIAMWDDGSGLAIGTPGGDVQIQAMVQVWLNITQHGMSLQQAVEAPRLASYSFPDSFAPHGYYPGRVNLESRFDPTVRAELAGLGHKVQEWPDWAWRAGAVCVVRRDGKSGTLEAAADPRRPAYALGR